MITTTTSKWGRVAGMGEIESTYYILMGNDEGMTWKS
jgi:hypothetical protein